MQTLTKQTKPNQTKKQKQHPSSTNSTIFLSDMKPLTFLNPLEFMMFGGFACLRRRALDYCISTFLHYCLTKSLFRNHQIVYDAVKLFVFLLFVYSLDKQ